MRPLAKILKRDKLQPFIENPSKVTLVEAPFGYGKTYFLKELETSLEKRGRLVSTLNLTPRFNRKRFFIRNIVDMFEPILGSHNARLIDFLEETTNPNLEDISEEIETIFEFIDQKAFLLVDNLQLINDPEIKTFFEDLTYISELRLVFSSRDRIDIRLDAIGQRQIAQIGIDELRFSQKLTSSLINDVYKIPLPQQGTVTRIWEQVDGWPGVLSILCEEIIETNYEIETATKPKVLEAFAGNRPGIKKYLDTNLLDDISADLQNFLFRSSIFSDCDVHLCKALMAERANAIIGSLQSANFIKTDNVSNDFKFSYPEVLREYFEYKLQFESDFLVKEELISVAEHYQKNGNEARASLCFLEAKEFTKGTRLLSKSKNQLISQGNFKKLESCFKKIPEEYINQDIDLLLLHGWVQIQVSDWKTVENNLSQIEKLLDTKPIEPYQRKSIEDQIYALTISSYVSKYDYKSANEKISSELEKFDLLDDFNHGSCLVDYITIKLANNDFKGIETIFERSKQINQRSNNFYAYILTYALETIYFLKIGFVTGSITSLDHIYAQLNTCSGSFNHFNDFVLPIEGLFYFEKSQLSSSYVNIAMGYHDIENNSPPWIRSLVIRRYATTNALNKHYTASQWIINEFNAYIDQNAGEHAVFRTNFDLIKILILCKEIEQANKSLAKFDFDYQDLTLSQKNVVASLWIANQEYAKAIQHLSQKSEPNGCLWDECEKLLLLTIANDLNGDQYNAIMVFDEFCKIVNEHYAALFLEHGKEAISVVQKYASQMILTKNVDDKAKLKTLFGRVFELYNELHQDEKISFDPTNSDTNSAEAKSEHQLIEPLSKKEAEVLDLMLQGMSNKKIADSLGVSINTVKWHVRHILEKFNVEKRTEVIAICNQSVINAN